LRSVPFIHRILKCFQPNDQACCSACIGFAASLTRALVLFRTI
jgi:hypothetical protein